MGVSFELFNIKVFGYDTNMKHSAKYNRNIQVAWQLGILPCHYMLPVTRRPWLESSSP